MNKGRAFKQITEQERVQIEVLLNQGLTISAIARILCRPVCTIGREIKRNGPKVYRSSRAQYQTDQRHLHKPKRVTFDLQMRCYIDEQLRTVRWSPEFISAQGKKLRADFVSHESIYKWIWSMKFSQRKADKHYQGLFKYLQHASRRRKRGRQRQMRGNIIYRRWIDERSAEASARKRQGDLEADIILGKDRKPGLLVALDRKTRKAWIRKLKTKDASYVMDKLKAICSKIGNVRTVTFDNDQSFAQHYRLQKMGIETFFTHPYSSQEKGSVENRIGIIRMFFPKQTQFNLISEQKVREIENIINDRPLRMFGYKSPQEIFNPIPKKLKTKLHLSVEHGIVY